MTRPKLLQGPVPTSPEAPGRPADARIPRPLLRVEGENISLFHDSFRRFLLGVISNFDDQDKVELGTRVVAFLEGEDFFESDRSFKYLWHYLRMAEHQSGVCESA